MCAHAVRHQASAPTVVAQPAASQQRDPLRSVSGVKAGQRLYALGLSLLEKQRASASACIQVQGCAQSDDIRRNNVLLSLP